MNNYKYEFGLQYAFLNDSEGFSELIKHYYQIDKEKGNKEKKNAELESKLSEYNRICKIKNFIFYFVEKKSGFQKNAVILSLPIDRNMLLQANKMSVSYMPKQRMFLSHPAAVFKNADKSALPRCTKADAIRIILQSMLKDEKAVIFSQFIDVLNEYADICHSLGFPVIIITGNDKGEKLKRKLMEFEHTASIKVLLTTLQKSAEGFNFPFATHVIILELWWNPQKIIQAMSRIDRKTQERNIFIYILCYNDGQTMIKHEICFYTKMIRKLNEANAFFQENEKIHPIKNPSLQTLYTEMPEMKLFTNIYTFENKLKSYITQLEHTFKYENITIDFQGCPLFQTKIKLLEEANISLKYLYILENTPWRIETEEVKQFLEYYYRLRINENYGNLFNQTIEDDIINFNLKSMLNSYYQIIFIDRFVLKIQLLNGYIENLSLVILIGKKRNGKFDLLGIYYIKLNNYSFIFSDLKERGVKRVRLIMTNTVAIKYIKKFLPHYFSRTVCQYCLSKLLKRIINVNSIHPEEMNYIDRIFSASTYYKALRVCKEAKTAGLKNNFIFNKINKNLPYNKKLFEYKPKNRKIIGTLNIVTFIIHYLSILTNNKSFSNVPEAIAYVNYAADKILQNGKHFIPNWDILASPIDQ